MIRIIDAIAELLFFSTITAISPLKPGFHMIAVIAAIAGKCFLYNRYDRCDH